MKKFYFRLSYCWFLFLLIPLSIITICLVSLPNSGYTFQNYQFWVLIFALIFFTVYLIANISFHITFDKYEVRITSDSLPKDEKIQYAESVRYEDII